MRPVRHACAVFLFLVAAQAGPTSGADPAPDATITFRGRNAAVGVGFSWGASTLEFQGKTYRCASTALCSAPSASRRWKESAKSLVSDRRRT